MADPVQVARLNGPSVTDTLEFDVQKVLDGFKSASPNRANEQTVLCPAIKPGYTAPVQGDPSMTVTISPNSPGASSKTSSIPNVTTLAAWSTAGYIQALGANVLRNRFVLQNNGATNIYVVFGRSVANRDNVTSSYHLKIVPSQTYIDELWDGEVDITSDAAGGVCSIIELTP